MSVTLKFTALTAKSNIIKTDGLISEVTRYTEAFVDKNVIKVAQDYPPERPNQRYVRTFRLQRSWKLKTTYNSGGLQVKAVTEGVSYYPLVQGLKQIPMHTETGWPVIPRLAVDRQVYRAGLIAIYKRRAV